MTSDGLADIFRRSRLPDPCTFLFELPTGAPNASDEEGRRFTVAHWVYNAGRAGHAATPADSQTGHGRPTWCGDIDLDGLTYQVHRGPRKRILVIGPAAGREHWFELREAVWVEPVEPEPVRVECPWCDNGPPPTLRDVAEFYDEYGIHIFGVSEYPEGEGRSIIFQTKPDGPDEEDVAYGWDTYCMVLEPKHHTHYGGISECLMTDDTLTLVLGAAAVQALEIGPELRFTLALDAGQRALLRTGLRRSLEYGRPDARPTRLEL